MTHEQEVTETDRWNHVPRSVGGAAEALVGARGEARRLQRIFERTPVPALMVDAQRRHLEAPSFEDRVGQPPVLNKMGV